VANTNKTIGAPAYWCTIAGVNPSSRLRNQCGKSGHICA